MDILGVEGCDESTNSIYQVSMKCLCFCNKILRLAKVYLKNNHIKNEEVIITSVVLRSHILVLCLHQEIVTQAVEDFLITQPTIMKNMEICCLKGIPLISVYIYHPILLNFLKYTVMSGR